MYSHLQSLELAFFDRQQTGQLMSRATVDLQSVRFFLGYGLIFMLQSGLTIVLAAVAMFLIEPGLAAISLAPGAVRRVHRRALRPPLAAGAAGGPAADRRADRRRRGERRRRARRQGLRARGPPARALPRQVGRVFDQSMVATRLQAFYNPFIGFLPQVGLAAILFFGGRQVIHGDADARPVHRLLHLPADAARRRCGRSASRSASPSARRPSGARLFQILDREPQIVAPAGAPRAAAGQRPRRAARRHAAYDGAKRPALRDVDARRRRPGTTVALVGATGSGKTTLVQLIPRLYDVDRRAPCSSTAPTCATSTSSPAPRDRRRRRRPVPVQRHVAENIAYARADATPRGDRARRAPRAGPRVHRAPARRLRHARRRARADAAAAASASASRSPARSSPTRGSSSSTTRPRGRRLDRAGDQAGAARGDGRAARRSSSPTACRRSRSPTRSSCSRTARIVAHGTHDDLLEAVRAVPRDRREGPARPGLPHPQRRASARWRACERRRRRRPRGPSRARRPAPPAARDRRPRAQAPRPDRAAAPVPRRASR